MPRCVPFERDVLARAVGRPHRLHAGGLSGAEVVEAGVVRVIHEVVDRVDAGGGAGVAVDGAAERGGLLGRGVVDVITGLGSDGASLIWARKDGALAIRVDVAASGQVAALWDTAASAEASSGEKGAPGKLVIHDGAGRTLTDVALQRGDGGTNDVAIDATGTTAYVGGFKNTSQNGGLTVPFILAFGLDGAPRWTAYDHAYDPVFATQDVADSFISRLHFGTDGRLYALGGNTVFGRDPQDLGVKVELTQIDQYNEGGHRRRQERQGAAVRLRPDRPAHGRRGPRGQPSPAAGSPSPTTRRTRAYRPVSRLSPGTAAAGPTTRARAATRHLAAPRPAARAGRPRAATATRHRPAMAGSIPAPARRRPGRRLPATPGRPGRRVAVAAAPATPVTPVTPVSSPRGCCCSRGRAGVGVC